MKMKEERMKNDIRNLESALNEAHIQLEKKCRDMNKLKSKMPNNASFKHDNGAMSDAESATNDIFMSKFNSKQTADTNQSGFKVSKQYDNSA
jgi:hypothetical protein